MNLIKGLKHDTIEKLADLWSNKNFQELVRILRNNRDLTAKRILVSRTNGENWFEVHDAQERAEAFAVVIKMVEQAYKKINKENK